MDNKGQSCYARSTSQVWAALSIKVGLIVIDNRHLDKRIRMRQGAANVFNHTAWGMAASGGSSIFDFFLEYTHLRGN